MFQTLFYQPILNLLVFLCDIIPGHDLGTAIILLTIIIKIILYPLSKKSITSQKALQDLQPKIEEIKLKYKDRKEEMGRAMMELYKNNKVNPFSSCLPLLIQLPFLWAVFKVFSDGIAKNTQLVYSFIPKPEMVNNSFFGVVDLSQPSIYLAILAGIAQFWQAKMMMTKKPKIISEGSKDENMLAAMNKQMVYIMPIITVMLGVKFPGGVMLYWLTTTVLTGFQQMYIFSREDKKILAKEGFVHKLKHKKQNVIEGQIIEEKKEKQ